MTSPEDHNLVQTCLRIIYSKTHNLVFSHLRRARVNDNELTIFISLNSTWPNLILTKPNEF